MKAERGENNVGVEGSGWTAERYWGEDVVLTT